MFQISSHVLGHFKNRNFVNYLLFIQTNYKFFISNVESVKILEFGIKFLKLYSHTGYIWMQLRILQKKFYKAV